MTNKRSCRQVRSYPPIRTLPPHTCVCPLVNDIQLDGTLYYRTDKNLAEGAILCCTVHGDENYGNKGNSEPIYKN